jgi:hypothetical protein
MLTAEQVDHRAGLAGVSGVAPKPDRPSGTKAALRQFDLLFCKTDSSVNLISSSALSAAETR